MERRGQVHSTMFNGPKPCVKNSRVQKIGKGQLIREISIAKMRRTNREIKTDFYLSGDRRTLVASYFFIVKVTYAPSRELGRRLEVF